MKRFPSRAVTAIPNGVLAPVLVVVAVVCFYPTAAHVSGLEDRVHYRGTSADGVSLMFNVYWGTQEVEGILEALAEYDAKATFFIGGSWADDNTACVRKIVEEGHEVGSHGYFHREHDKLSLRENVEEIGTSVEFLSLVTGKQVSLFAPPSGAYSEDTLRAAESLGLKTVLWSRDTIDWRDKDVALCYTRATKDVKGGYLILMRPMEHTLKALPKMLQYYEEQGLAVIPAGENIG